MSKPMLKTRLTIGAKYLIYVLIVYFSYILQVTPSLFSIAGVRPVLVLPAVICIAMFEGELAGALIGAFGGLLCDLSSSLIYGFNGLLFLIFCAAAGLLVFHLMRLTLTNALIFSFAALAIRDLMEFYFLYVLWGYEGASLIFLRKFLPSIFYSLLFTFPYFWLVRRIKVKWDLLLEK